MASRRLPAAGSTSFRAPQGVASAIEITTPVRLDSRAPDARPIDSPGWLRAVTDSDEAKRRNAVLAASIAEDVDGRGHDGNGLR
jgi:hypothetical protein